MTNMAAQLMPLLFPVTEDSNSNCDTILAIPTALFFSLSLRAKPGIVPQSGPQPLPAPCVPDHYPLTIKPHDVADIVVK
jgi:hypothetical protein